MMASHLHESIQTVELPTPTPEEATAILQIMRIRAHIARVMDGEIKLLWRYKKLMVRKEQELITRLAARIERNCHPLPSECPECKGFMQNLGDTYMCRDCGYVHAVYRRDAKVTMFVGKVTPIIYR